MNFQYFFFDTYVGYFLQVFPIAIISSVVYGVLINRKNGKEMTKYREAKILFVCYLTGLICLVLALDIIKAGWYHLIYNIDSGVEIQLFKWEYNFVPKFYMNIDSHTIGNLIMFLPFGFIYPLTHKECSWGTTLLAGMICVMAIEIFQPVFGRSFDIDDIIMNGLGILVSATIFFSFRKLSTRYN